jgi:hypothetical protein
MPRFSSNEWASRRITAKEIEEDVYLVDFPFYDQIVRAQATFVAGNEILIGTRLLRPYRLEVNFPGQTVVIDSSTSTQT